MERFERYLKIVQWALRRYSVEGEIVRLQQGKPGKFGLIERLAAQKYLEVSKPR
jgi:hypothetical protein